VAAGALLAEIVEVPAACVMLFDIAVDAYVILHRVIFQWALGRGLYFNELMAKKLSLLWAVACILTS